MPDSTVPIAGSSPHTRGARGRTTPTGNATRIIPAYAGSTKIRPSRVRRTSDHPRIRGEHIYNNLKVPEQAGSSPHTRGAHRQDRDPRAVAGIIPAYAGSTRSA